MKSVLVVSLFIMGAVWCQQDLLDQLPPLTDINVNDIETAVLESYAKDALTMLKEKCSNSSGGDEVYEELQVRAKSFQTFITDNINFTVVMTELDEAKKTGSMDEVFAKYCAKKPEAMTRFRNITETFKKCLAPEEQKSLDAKLNLTEKMVHFLCEKDGDKIAMFIANGGEECLSSKFQGLQECFNQSSSVIPSNWQTLSLVDADEKICEEFPTLEKCIVTVLEECKIKTPANIMGALFRYLRKNMDCAPTKDAVVADFVSTNRLKRATDSVAARLQRKCEINNGPDAYRNLEITYQNFMLAFQDNILHKNDECSILKRSTDFQLGAFVLSLKACMTPAEDFVPNYIRNIVEEIFDYFCEDNGKKLDEFKKSTGLQCLGRRNISRFGNCAKPTYSHKTEGNQIILEEKQFCRDIDTVQECMSTHLVKPCSQDPRFKEISEHILEIVNDKCSGCSISVNFFLICGLILFQLKKYVL